MHAIGWLFLQSDTTKFSSKSHSAFKLFPRITGTPDGTKLSVLIFEPNGPIAIAFGLVALISSIVELAHSAAISQPLQVLPNSLFQSRTLRKLRFQFLRQPLHLLLERLTIILYCFSADIPTGRENIAVLLDFFELGCLAEAGDVFILLFQITAPGVVGIGDTLDLFVGKIPGGRGRTARRAFGHR